MTALVMDQVTAPRHTPRPATARVAALRSASTHTHSARPMRTPQPVCPQPVRPDLVRRAISPVGARLATVNSCVVVVPASAPVVRTRTVLTPRGLALVTLFMLALMVASLVTIVSQFWMISS